jgi:predicted DNA-binding transcriptional regulator YafY
MITINKAFGRYQIIDNLISKNNYPTIKDIIKVCSVELGQTPKPDTIQKDIAVMKLNFPKGFNAPIKYDFQMKGYKYKDHGFRINKTPLREEDLEAIFEAADVMRFMGGSGIAEGFSHAAERILSFSLESTLSKEAFPILQTMKPPKSRGFEHFKLFFAACKDKHPVSLIHFSYRKRVFSHRIIHPFLIKEFENRWYVIGYSESHREVRTYGLDRIFEPVALAKKYIQSTKAEIEKYLNQVYGVYPIPKKGLEEVKIRVSSLATHYFQAYPLHETQKIVKYNNGTSLISFHLVPTFELLRYFKTQGKEIKIQSPSWLSKYKIQ